MRMDPVVILAEELRAAESSLCAAKCQQRHDDAREFLAEIRLLEDCLAQTEPTSALGAAELLRLAAASLEPPQARMANRLAAIAEHLSEGKRALKDMIWLRATARRLESGAAGETGPKAARLLLLAVNGASRPVLVYRAALPPACESDKTFLSRGQ